MTAVRQIKWTRRGQERFREQQDYITNDNCHEVALEWGRRVIDATRNLDRFPLSGRIVPEIGRPEIRELIIDGHFRIIYKVRRDFCDILSIRHTAFLIKSIRSL